MGDGVLGLLKVRVLRGHNLAVRDILRSSDPYVVVRMGDQKLRTRVIKKNLNPVWNEELTLSVETPTLPIKLEVYDKDTFSLDDPMGKAELDIRSLFEAAMMDLRRFPDGCVVTTLVPNRQNCLSEESVIRLEGGGVVQDVFLRLRNVECGEIELQLRWINIRSARSASLQDYL